MYKELAKKYIKRLTPQDIKNYANNINIEVNNKEVNIIFDFLVKNYNELLNKNDKVLKNLKPLIRNDLYQKILILYEENKNKYL